MNDNNIWNLFNEISMKLEFEPPDDLICVICKRILINAHQGPCGCLYCKNCITNYLINEIYCPGNEADCHNVELSLENNIKLDNSSNRRVMRLKVKCPSVLCTFQDDIRKLLEHYRLCDKRDKLCPYKVMGCATTGFNDDNILEDHLKEEVSNHTTLLIEWIMNMKNEFMTPLATNHQELPIDTILDIRTEMGDILNKLEEEKSRTEENIIQLRRDLLETQRKNEELAMEMTNLKIENDNQIQQMNEWIQLIHLDIETLSRGRDSITTNVIENQSSGNVMGGQSSGNVMGGQSSGNVMGGQPLRNVMGGQPLRNVMGGQPLRNVMGAQPLRNVMEDQLLRNVMGGQPSTSYILLVDQFLMKLDKIFERKLNGGNVCSEYFYMTSSEYQMQLSLYPKGYGNHYNTCFSIHLCIYDAMETENVSLWPFNQTVTIVIADATNENVRKSITKSCRIDKCEYEEFNFLYNESNSEDLWKNDKIIIICSLEMG